MTHTQLVHLIHDATGYEGRELEVMVHFYCMLRADVFGDKNTGDYFERRMREAFAKGE